MCSKEEKLKSLSVSVEKFKYKLRFSINSFVFFLSMMFIHMMNPVFGSFVTIGFGIASLVFIQQIIRSYNYLKFYKMSYNAYVIMHEVIEDMK